MVRISFLTLSTLSVGIFATSCGTDHSQARFLHAAPGTVKQSPPILDIAVDGKTEVTNLAFEGLAPGGGYVTVTAGNRRVEARTTGTTTDLINSIVSFGGAKQYTILVSGNTAAHSIAFLQKTDDNSAPPSGSIKLRVIHAAPDGNDHLDVYVVAPLTDITNMTPTISALAYQQASDYQTAAAATYEVIMTNTGDATKDRKIDQTYTLSTGQIRTLVTVDEQVGGAMSPTPLVFADLN